MFLHQTIEDNGLPSNELSFLSGCERQKIIDTPDNVKTRFQDHNTSNHCTEPENPSNTELY